MAGDEDVIPYVDLLERIYEGATVRLAPNNEESATITFNTGVAQGSITSPPELATELFTSKDMGVFRFSAALIEWF